MRKAWSFVIVFLLAFSLTAFAQEKENPATKGSFVTILGCIEAPHVACTTGVGFILRAKRGMYVIARRSMVAPSIVLAKGEKELRKLTLLMQEHDSSPTAPWHEAKWQYAEAKTDLVLLAVKQRKIPTRLALRVVGKKRCLSGSPVLPSPFPPAQKSVRSPVPGWPIIAEDGSVSGIGPGRSSTTVASMDEIFAFVERGTAKHQ